MWWHIAFNNFLAYRKKATGFIFNDKTSRNQEVLSLWL